MLETEDLVEFFTALAVILVLSVFITLAWVSTYVRDQPIVATAVVVFQQEPSPTTSSMTTSTASTSTCSSPIETTASQTVSHETQDGMTPSEQDDDETLSSSDEVKSSRQDGDLEHEQQEEDFTPCKSAEEQQENDTEDIKRTEEISGQSFSDNNKNLDVSNLIEAQSVSEEGSCSPSSSVLRSRNKNKSTEGNNVIESLNNSDSEHEAFEAEVQCENFPRESIRIKLKFLDDTQRLVRGQLSDEVGNFKRANFDPELSDNRVVRLIFNGQLLNRDSTTLGQYGLFDNCVVHCHISQPQPSNANDRNNLARNQENDLDLSEILSPLLLVVMAFLWYLRYEYSQIFNTSATIILVCLTAMLLISQYALTISLNVSWSFDRGNNSDNGSPSSPQSNPRIEQAPAAEVDEETRRVQRASPSSGALSGDSSGSVASSEETERRECRNKTFPSPGCEVASPPGNSNSLDTEPTVDTPSHSLFRNTDTPILLNS